MSDEKKVILSIDDDADIRNYYRTLLEEHKFNLIEAENGKIGIQLLEKEKPDLVLLDLRMPEMDGLDVLKYITEKSPQTPVIVVSATDSIDDVVKSLRMGAWDFIMKPFYSYSILLHRIQKVMERSWLQKQNHEYHIQLEEALSKLKTDLEAGRVIQAKLLPQKVEVFNNYKFESLILPSLYLSGDFVNYFKIDDSHTAFYMADVSGHGVSSALVTVLLKSFINNSFEQYSKNQNNTILDPSALLESVNEEFLKENLNKFSTIFYGVINTRENILLYCNGGHFPFPVLINNGKSTLLESKTTPVGITNEVKYENVKIKLGKDFSLKVFSDGILDILPQDLLEEKIDFLVSLHASKSEDYDEFISNLVENSVGLPDDITILSVRKEQQNARQ